MPVPVPDFMLGGMVGSAVLPMFNEEEKLIPLALSREFMYTNEKDID